MKKQYQALLHDRLHDLDDSEGLNGNDEADGYDDDDDWEQSIDQGGNWDNGVNDWIRSRFPAALWLDLF